MGPNTPDLNLAVSTLSKYFEVGDYVKVVEGDHQGDVGYVMSVDFGRGPKWNKDSTARVLASSITTEFSVRIENLQLTAQKADTVIEMDGFTVGELVALDSRGGNSRGVITRLEAGTRAVVLGSDGRKFEVALQELTTLKDGK